MLISGIREMCEKSGTSEKGEIVGLNQVSAIAGKSGLTLRGKVDPL